MSPRPPRLDDLTARFLARAAVDPVEAADAEVVPHEVFGGFRADPRTAWAEAVAAVRLFGRPADAPAPAGWAAYAAAPARSPALPLAAGVFAQQLHDPIPLLAAADLAALRPVAGPVCSVDGVGKAGRTPAAALAAAGVLAASGDRDGGLAVLATVEPLCGGDWRPAWSNQRAAVLWLGGRAADAVAAWEGMADHPVVAYNLGMGRLFGGMTADAVAPLRAAAERLPATSGWAHLAGLLLAVAKARG